MADSFELTTAKATGETMTIAVGCESPRLTVTWADGSTETLTTAGLPLEIQLKSTTFSISSTGSILSLYAPDAELTAIAFTDMGNLQQLVVPNNQLASIDLSGLSALEVLDVQNNNLTSLTMTRYCSDLVSLNCAYNQLTTLTVGSKSALTTLICAGNSLSTLTLSTLPNLQTLWCQDNSLTRLSLSSNSSLRKLYAFNNQLSSITSVPASLTEIWVDQNALTTLDLEPAVGLKEIIVDHNQLSLIEMSSDNSSTLDYFYAHGNALSFNSFPTVSNLTAYAVSPQEPFDLGVTPVIGEEINISAYFYSNAWGSTTGALTTSHFTWHDASTDEALTEGEDYTRRTSGCYTFLKAFPGGVYAIAESTRYPEPIQTATINVVTTGIGGITSAAGLDISTSAGTLTVESQSPVQVKVFNAAGILMVNTQATAGTHSWTLARGVYIVNGEKVFVP